MSWSLQIKNGDLVLDHGQMGQVTGIDKLAQDIRCALLERMGTDDLHPGYGSILDGGRTPDGAQVEGVIGEIDRDVIFSFVSNEVNRVVREHQAQQITRAKQDRLRYNKTTLTYGEVVDDFSVNLAMSSGTMVVHIVVVSKSGNESAITIPIAA